MKASTPRSVAGLVLAAGSATRFGGNKLLALLHGKPVLRHAVERLQPQAAAPALAPIVVVVRPADHDEVREALRGLNVSVVRNPGHREGMASSLRLGLAAMPGSARAVVVALGDQPFVPPEVVRCLLRAYQEASRPIACPVYEGARGHPVLFDRSVWPELLALSGPRGGRAVIDADPARVTQVPVAWPLPVDIDRPEDLAHLDG